MFINWDFILSTVAVGAAIIALIQSHQQLKLSNKQHLFDKRLENYLIAKGLIELYQNSCENFNKEKKDEPFFEMKSMFGLMTNNTYLEQIALVIMAPLENPKHKEFLIKLEDMKKVAAKIEFLFSGKAAVILKDFVLSYQELLFRMYQYQLALIALCKNLQGLKPEEEDQKLNPQDLQEKYELKVQIEKCPSKTVEKQQRAECLKALKSLEQSYELLKKENVEQEIKKQIELKSIF